MATKSHLRGPFTLKTSDPQPTIEITNTQHTHIHMCVDQKRSDAALPQTFCVCGGGGLLCHWESRMLRD